MEEVETKPTSAFAHLFKSRGEDSQTRRRKMQLEMQRQRRERVIFRNRHGDESEDESGEEEEERGEEETINKIQDGPSESAQPLAPSSSSSSSSSSLMDDETEGTSMMIDQTQQQRNRTTRKKKTKRGRRQRGRMGPRKEDVKDQLMIPEDLLEIPEDLKESWLLVPIPQEAERCLIVSSGSSTSRFSVSGDLIDRFPSLLPCGNVNGRGGECFLDCFFFPPTQTFFILDMLMWNGSSFVDCDTSFRWFFLQQKISEIRRIQSSSESNRFPFFQVHHFDCNLSGLQAAVSSPLLPFPPHHVLLYHKDTHYDPGPSPLLCSVPASSALSLLSPHL